MMSTMSTQHSDSWPALSEDLPATSTRRPARRTAPWSVMFRSAGSGPPGHGLQTSSDQWPRVARPASRRSEACSKRTSRGVGSLHRLHHSHRWSCLCRPHCACTTSTTSTTRTAAEGSCAPCSPSLYPRSGGHRADPSLQELAFSRVPSEGHSTCCLCSFLPHNAPRFVSASFHFMAKRYSIVRTCSLPFTHAPADRQLGCFPILVTMTRLLWTFSSTSLYGYVFSFLLVNT